MVSRPVTLKGQMHVCPMVDPGPRPHIGGPVISTQQNFVTVDGVPVATVGDSLLCTGVPTTSDKITSGSSVASIEGKKVARMGDSCAHGGKLVQGVSWLTFDGQCARVPSCNIKVYPHVTKWRLQPPV